MSTTPNRDKAARDAGPVEHRLARLLDAPFLARVVPHLAPETLQQIVRHRGLEACGELVASATPAQLTALLDIDLWRQQPGHDERFDAERFGEWLEVLVEAGDSEAARIVAALDESLVVAGLSRYVRVFDPGTFEPTESSDDERRDRRETLRSEADGDLGESEVGGYLLRARRTDAWDAIVTLLVALETEHPHSFHAVMRGCRRLSNSRPEIDGLDELLAAAEQHLQDVAIERERRRSQRGYATAADARAFLLTARRPRPAPGTDAQAHASIRSPHRASRSPASWARTASAPLNPIAAAYFREAGDPGEAARPRERDDDADFGMRKAETGDEESDVPARSVDRSPASSEAVIGLLVEAGVMPAPPRALLHASRDDTPASRVPTLGRLMAFVLDLDETAYLTRSRELAFLANTLLTGCTVQARPFTSGEASDAAACICNLGLESWPSGWPGVSREVSASREPDAAAPDELLVKHDLVTAFEVGWSVLHRDVSLFVMDRLIPTLDDICPHDADTRRELRALRRTLVKQREAGTPWLACDAADVLATIDATAWTAVRGLLDECPVVPAALTAVLERRTTSVSATAFEFFSTRAQIGDVRVFMRMLPGLLGG